MRYAVFKIESSGCASSQVCDASHVQASGHLPQPLSTCDKEAAEQATRAEFLLPDTPNLGVNPQPIEDPGQIRRDHGLSRAKEPPSVIDQKEIASDRKSVV